MAVATLTEIMNDEEARAADRIAASKALISGAQAFQERKMLERTIADLEQQLYGMSEQAPPPEPVPGTDLLDPDMNLLASADPDTEDE
jgi:hypothetical protein